MANGEAIAHAMICTLTLLDQNHMPSVFVLSRLVPRAHHHPRMGLDQPPRVRLLIPQPLPWSLLDRDLRRIPSIRAARNVDQLDPRDTKVVMHGRESRVGG